MQIQVNPLNLPMICYAHIFQCNVEGLPSSWSQMTPNSEMNYKYLKCIPSAFQWYTSLFFSLMVDPQMTSNDLQLRNYRFLKYILSAFQWYQWRTRVSSHLGFILNFWNLSHLGWKIFGQSDPRLVLFASILLSLV